MDKKQVKIIDGGIARDHRGQIRFVNDFDMEQVKRFYVIAHSDTSVVRGWKGHRVEQRWFYVLSGAFSIDLVKIDDWKNSSRHLSIEKRILVENESRILHVPEGYATAFQAMRANSELLAFADHGIDNAKYDDYVWPIDYFVNRIQSVLP